MKLSNEFINILKTAENIGILTGAGISADSGIETFRGKDGHWKNHDVQELATLNGFLEDPELVWSWYNERRVEVAKSGPNPAHTGVAELERFFSDVGVITQNVDGLHQKAGSSKVWELHGNIWELRSMEDGTVIENFDVPLKEIPPKCKSGGYYRPNVVWFGEALPEKALTESINIASHSDVFLVIGTSAVVQPAANIPIIAKRSGAYIVEINIEKTPLSPFVDVTLLGKAKDTVPELLNKIKKIKK